jgi:hypothetical protein
MPFESEAQRKAMYAAATGKSNIGIPEKVAKKFIKHSTDETQEELNSEWLEKVLLAEMIKPDEIPEEPTPLSTPENKFKSFKGDLAAVSKIIQGMKDQPQAKNVLKKDADPCWEGYQQVGMKEKDGKSVPNCVPDAAELVAKTPEIVMPIANNAGAAGRASGIMFVTGEGHTLLIRRGAGGGDYPNTWCVPGGHQKGNETLEEAARRECREETGIDYKGKLEVLHDDGQFCTYIARDVKKEEVKLNYESTGYDWCDPLCPPLPLHPGLAVAFKIASAKTETDVAQLMADDLLPSPQMYANVGLFAIRITGTGLAYRSSIKENVWRDPSLYLNDEFLKRCNGLMVIMDHPESAVLTSKEFKDRAVGSIMLPYIKGDEVWGIAKIYDQDAVNEICEGEISTSPSVVFDNTAENTTLTTENGEPLLIEGVPFLLDHIAIVTKARGSKGVWDKGGNATGVLLNNQEVSDMNDNTIAPKADAQGDKLDAVLAVLGDLAARMDAMEKELPAPPLVTAADKKAKKDEDEEEAKMDESEKAAPLEVSDSKKKRKDAVGSDPKEHDKGEIKPDDEGEIKEPGHMDFKKDEDEEEEAKKADDEEAEYADAQAKADSVLSSFGKSASRPLKGEGLMSYRKRLLRGLQAYSDSYKSVNLAGIKDVQILNIAEKTIFADALMAARSPSMFGSDQLIEINEKDRAGRTITKFKGAMEAWLGDFKVPSMRVKEFHLFNNKR